MIVRRWGPMPKMKTATAMTTSPGEFSHLPSAGKHFVVVDSDAADDAVVIIVVIAAVAPSCIT